MIATSLPYKISPEMMKDLLEMKPPYEIIIEQLAKDAANKEQEILMNAITKHLGRPAVIEDAKDCEMVTTPDTPRFCYFFFYKGVKLGYMEKSDFKMTYGNGQDFIENKYTIYQEMRFIPQS